MPKVKFPLQEEIEKDLLECSEYLYQSHNIPLAQEIAIKYCDAMKRIQRICENRKRY